MDRAEHFLAFERMKDCIEKIKKMDKIGYKKCLPEYRDETKSNMDELDQLKEELSVLKQKIEQKEQIAALRKEIDELKARLDKKGN